MLHFTYPEEEGNTHYSTDIANAEEQKEALDLVQSKNQGQPHHGGKTIGPVCKRG